MARLYDGGPLVKIRWFFAPKGAKPVPMPNLYASRVWDDPKTPPAVNVGDIVGRAPAWAPADNPLGYTGQGHSCGTSKAWATGTAPFSEFVATDNRGVPSCCQLLTQLAQGGPGVGGTAWPGKPLQVGKGGFGTNGAAGQTGKFLFLANGGVGLGGKATFRSTQTANGGVGLGGWAGISPGNLELDLAGVGIGGEAGFAPANLQFGEGGVGFGGDADFGSGILILGGGGLGIGGDADFETDMPIIGELRCFAAGVSPAGWLLCNGQSVSQSTYSALFALLGTTWGPTGSSNFTLPDFRRRTFVGQGGIGTGVLGNAIGNNGGEETHLLLSGESGVPAHNHQQTAAISFTGGSQAGAANTYFTGSGQGAQGSFTDNNTATNASTGHNNIQPSNIVQVMIYAGV